MIETWQLVGMKLEHQSKFWLGVRFFIESHLDSGWNNVDEVVDAAIRNFNVTSKEVFEVLATIARKEPDNC